MALDLVADALAILADEDTFGQPVTVTDPSGAQASLAGFGLEIGTTLDPDTGAPVSGPRASLSLPLSPFRAAFGASALPLAVADGAGLPWVVAFDDSDGVPRMYRVVDTMPDLKLGVVTCMLEVYQ